MKIQSRSYQKGVTLVELLVVLVVFSVIVGGIYRVFTAQSRAYSVQDQVVEVQQTTRSAMEVLLRDLRMTGYDNDSMHSKITIPTPVAGGDSNITVSYEVYDRTVPVPPQIEQDRYFLYTVAYRTVGSELRQQITRTDRNGVQTIQAEETVLENVDSLNFTYGVDGNEDGVMDDLNGNGQTDDWILWANVAGRRVVAVRVALTARPEPTNQDVQKMVSPRSLVSVVTMRNLCLNRS